MVTNKLKTLASLPAMVSKSRTKLSIQMVLEKTRKRTVKKLQKLQVSNLKLEKIAETFIEITIREELETEMKKAHLKVTTAMRALRLLRTKMPLEEEQDKLTSTANPKMEVTMTMKMNSLSPSLELSKTVEVLLLT